MNNPKLVLGLSAFLLKALIIAPWRIAKKSLAYFSSKPSRDFSIKSIKLLKWLLEFVNLIRSLLSYFQFVQTGSTYLAGSIFAKQGGLIDEGKSIAKLAFS